MGPAGEEDCERCGLFAHSETEIPPGMARSWAVHGKLGGRAVKRFALQREVAEAVLGDELEGDELLGLVEELEEIEAGLEAGRKAVKSGA